MEKGNKVFKSCSADATADLVYLAYLMHLFWSPMELIKELKQGQVLEILPDYDGALEDIPAWFAKQGQVAGIQQNPVLSAIGIPPEVAHKLVAELTLAIKEYQEKVASTSRAQTA